VAADATLGATGVTGAPTHRDDDDPHQVIDPTVPHSTHVWNHVLGGKDDYEVDRQATEAYKSTFPEIVDLAA
jgi:hypothetical protein